VQYLGNLTKMIDLHVHTNYSDGKHSPTEVIRMSKVLGLKAIAITDHDSVDAHSEDLDTKDIEIIPGIEISCNEKEIGFEEVHILGLFVDIKNAELINFSALVKKSRIEQKRKIIDKIISLGYDISYDEVASTVKASFSRVHIAKVLISKYPDEFKTIRDVFNKLIGAGKVAYVDRGNRMSVVEAVTLIKNAKGIPFLAHPGVYKKEDSLELINHFINCGGMGIETYYPYHIICPDLEINKEKNSELIEFYRKTASTKGLLETGGSDFHGGDRKTLGTLDIPDTILLNIKKYHQQDL